MRRLLVAVILAAVAFIAAPATGASAAGLPYYTGPYRLINQKSGMCLNQDKSGGTLQATLLAWPCSSTPAANEKWYEVFVDGELRVQLQNVDSGQCVNQNFSGGAEHSDVIAYSCSWSYGNGLWYPVNVGTSVYEFENGMTYKCLNQDYSGGTWHHTMLAWSCVNGQHATNNDWRLVPA
jgi:hypothetical protein